MPKSPRMLATGGSGVGVGVAVGAGTAIGPHPAERNVQMMNPTNNLCIRNLSAQPDQDASILSQEVPSIYMPHACPTCPTPFPLPIFFIMDQQAERRHENGEGSTRQGSSILRVHLCSSVVNKNNPRPSALVRVRTSLPI